MNKVLAHPFVRIHSKLLSEIINLGTANSQNLSKALISNYGIVAFKQAGGVLSDDLKAIVVDNRTLLVKGGIAVGLVNGEIIISIVPDTTFDVSSFAPSQTYYLYIRLQKSSYESGTITLTNNSKLVNITGGNFNKLHFNEYIYIDSSASGNNGLYQVAAVNSNSTLNLVDNFTGTTESSLKWKIVGYFGNNNNLANKSKVMYEYDSYILDASSNPSSAGFKIASFTLDGGGNVSSLIDVRSDNLFSLKPVNADNILRGLNNDITTVEEKYQASQIQDYWRDFVSRGVISGLIPELTSETNLQVTSGRARNVYGKKIDATETNNFDLAQLVTNLRILPGDNYLYLRYKETGQYEYIWLNNLSTDPLLVPIIKLTYNSIARPQFAITDIRDFSKFKASSFVSTGKGVTSEQGQLYFKKNVNGQGQYAFLRLNADGTALEEQIIIHDNLLKSELDKRFAELMRPERIRFSLVVTADKQGWFLHQGIPAPTHIGYDFRVLGMAVIQLSGIAVDGNENTNDYVSDVKDLMLTKVTLPEAQDYVAMTDVTKRDFQANKLLGVYFKMNNPREIQLIVDGNKVLTSTMQSDSGPSTANKFYVVEVTIQAIAASTAVPETIAS